MCGRGRQNFISSLCIISSFASSPRFIYQSCRYHLPAPQKLSPTVELSTSSDHCLFQQLQIVGENRVGLKTTKVPYCPRHLPSCYRGTLALIRRIHIKRETIVMSSEKSGYFGLKTQESGIRPHTPAPQSSTARSNLAKVQLRNFKPNAMVSNSVNKTALHPGGVE